MCNNVEKLRVEREKPNRQGKKIKKKLKHFCKKTPKKHFFQNKEKHFHLAPSRPEGRDHGHHLRGPGHLPTRHLRQQGGRRQREDRRQRHRQRDRQQLGECVHGAGHTLGHRHHLLGRCGGLHIVTEESVLR